MVDGFINFNLNEKTPTIIKVIGVGGGGGNAVEYMYEKGICDVDFVICNTDYQALRNSPIPCKIQLGKELTARPRDMEQVITLPWERSRLRRVWPI